MVELPMTPNPIKRILIAGGGSSGWMSAALLRKELPASIEIHLIESEDIPIIGVGEATIPTIRHFNDRIGLNEKAFVEFCQASFKLGIEFRGWGAQDSRYFHAFGDFGSYSPRVWGHQIHDKLRQAGQDVALDALSLPTRMAQQGRFFPPNPDPASLMSAYSYAYHFDASLYARFMRDHCEKAGVVRQVATIDTVRLDPDSGAIASLLLSDGTEVTADLFIDCTGFRALLIEGALKADFTDWSAWLPANRAWAAPTAHKPAPTLPPYTVSQAHDAGWQWRIPLQHRMGNGYVFSSDFADESKALDAFVQALDGAPLAEPRLLKFRTGHRDLMWHKNCVAIGLSAGFLEPLESTSIQLVQLGAITLIDLFPLDKDDAIARREYNKRMTGPYEAVRDFIIAHYHLNGRDDGELWRYCRAMAIPDSLMEKLAIYRQRGKVLIGPYEQFMTPSWVSILAGQGVHPEHVDPLVDGIAMDKALHFYRDRAGRIGDLVAKLPSHSAFIAEHCPSPS
jgi:tryptophan 7-halogenase